VLLLGPDLQRLRRSRSATDHGLLRCARSGRPLVARAVVRAPGACIQLPPDNRRRPWLRHARAGSRGSRVPGNRQPACPWGVASQRV